MCASACVCQLKAVIALVPVVIGLGVLLLGILLHCWLKNRK